MKRSASFLYGLLLLYSVTITKTTAQEKKAGNEENTLTQPYQKQFAPTGTALNSELYYQTNFSKIKGLESEMVAQNLGGFEDSPLHLKNGAVLFYKTNAGNYGKMQVLSFGYKEDNRAEFYMRYTTYKTDGTILKSSEYVDIPWTELGKGDNGNNRGYFYFDSQIIRAKNVVKKLAAWHQGSNYHKYNQQNGFEWKIENGLLFLNALHTQYYLVKNEISNTRVTETKTLPNPKITWQHNLPNNTISTSPTLTLKACVETTEPVKEYILVQSGQRSYTARGLIVQQANDCFNAFNKTVTLKTGENQFQLITQSNAGELKSEVFTITYNPNASTSNSQNNAKPQRRLALIIGNAAYPNAGLKNPANDATDIATALRAMGFEVINALNADRRKMNAAIDDFGTRLKNYDLGFFYYAGHGLQVKGENYLVPIDAVPQSQGEVEYECYPVGKILAKMEEAANQANIIVLDACRDNPLQRSWSRSTNSNGLANINAPQGTFIGFATSPGSTAADGTGRNGVYTGALLEHIRKPNLTVDQLFNAVNGTVKKLTNNLQIPWKASSMSEDLYLTK